MRDLYRSRHRDKTDTRKTSEDPSLPVWGRSVQTDTSVRVNRGNNGGPLERATLAEAFEEDNRGGVCPPLLSYKVVLGLCLLCAMFYSERA